LVIGGTANFTDIFETLSGFAEGLKVVKPKPNYPIVVRRAGPNDEKAFAMLKKLAAENDFDISLYGEETPMTLAAKLMAEKVKEHKLHK
jgi:succinyl-CoA synthetase beta subunit